MHTLPKLPALGISRPCAAAGLLLVTVAAAFGPLGGRVDAALPGSLDPAFKRDISAYIYAVSPMDDGSMLVAGGEFDRVTGFAGHLYWNGTYDGTFHWANSTPPASANWGGDVFALAVQADGKIVIGGRFGVYADKAHLHLARLNLDGILDSPFQPAVTGTGSLDYPHVSSVAIQPDQRILVAGYFTAVNDVARTNLARLNPDGTLDTSFDPVVPMPWVDQVVVQNDGRILAVAGQVIRLNSDGSTDETFQLDPSDNVSHIAVQPDGKIVLGAATDRAAGLTGLAGDTPVMVVRVNADGSRDPTFLPPLTGLAQWAVTSIVVQDDGKILIGSYLPVSTVYRLNSDGTLDGNFEAGFAGDLGFTVVLALEKSGKVLATGSYSINGQSQNLIRFYGGEPAPTAPVFETLFQWALSNGKALAWIPIREDLLTVLGFEVRFMPCDGSCR